MRRGPTGPARGRDRSGLAPRRRDRGQSVSITYTLSLIIVTVLISGLFISMSGFLDSERERVTRSELTVLGNRIAADISTADRLARTTDDGEVEVRTTIPESVAGSEYDVEISSTQFGTTSFYDVTVTLQEPETQVTRTVRVRTDFEVVTSRLNGGPYVVHFDGTDIEVTDD